MTHRENFTTPVGRFVSGSLTERRKTDLQNRPIPEEDQRYEFGLAIQKTDPGLPDLFQVLSGTAKQGYANNPQMQARVDAWFNTMSGFSMKVSDGDKPNQRTGQVNPNTAGCFVLWFSTALEIKTCGPDNVQIDPSSIKRGWYVDVYGSVAINGLTDNNAGIFLNPEWVRLRAYGEEIVGGIDPDSAFGSKAEPLGPPPAGNASGMPGAAPAGGNPTPPGASNPATSAPANTLPGASVGAGQAPGAAGYAGAPGGATASPGEQHPPHNGFMGLPGQTR